MAGFLSVLPVLAILLKLKLKGEEKTMLSKKKDEEKSKAVNVLPVAAYKVSSVELSAITNIKYSDLDCDEKLMAEYKLPILQFIKKSEKVEFIHVCDRFTLSFIDGASILEQLELEGVINTVSRFPRTFELTSNNTGLSVSNCQLLNTLEVAN